MSKKMCAPLLALCLVALAASGAQAQYGAAVEPHWGNRADRVDCRDPRGGRERDICRNANRGDRNDDVGAAIGAGIVGLTIGAIIAGAASEQNKRDEAERQREWIDYCARRYRSFDIATGTFIGYDGRRHACR